MKAETLNLVARIIASICLVTSVLVVSQAFVDLVGLGDGSKNGTSWSVETFESWTVHHSHRHWKKETHLISVGAFAFFYGMCSALLLYGTYARRRLLAMPWLFCDGTSIVCQAASLVVRCSKSESQPRDGVLVVALLGLGLSVLMWGAVFEAHRCWLADLWGSGGASGDQGPPAYPVAPDIYYGRSAPPPPLSASAARGRPIKVTVV